MTTRMPIAALYTLCSAFLLAGCLNVAETPQKRPQNKPHEGMSFRCDGYEPR